jgi:hypothetical protein
MRKAKELFSLRRDLYETDHASCPPPAASVLFIAEKCHHSISFDANVAPMQYSAKSSDRDCRRAGRVFLSSLSFDFAHKPGVGFFQTFHPFAPVRIPEEKETRRAGRETGVR